MAAPHPRPLGILRPELPRLRTARLPRCPLQAILRYILIIAIAAPVQDAAAQDPVGGAILGGAAGAILGGALGGGRGAAVGAIVGGATGAAIAAQGQPRPGGYRYYQQGCYQQRGDGAWVVVAPEYCAAAAAPPVAIAPPPRARV